LSDIAVPHAAGRTSIVANEFGTGASWKVIGVAGSKGFFAVHVFLSYHQAKVIVLQFVKDARLQLTLLFFVTQ
jgi:hypothetical protein